jgi:hypothetical protein
MEINHSVTLYTTNPTGPNLVSHCDRCSGKQTTDNLGHGTAVRIYLIRVAKFIEYQSGI